MAFDRLVTKGFLHTTQCKAPTQSLQVFSWEESAVVMKRMMRLGGKKGPNVAAMADEALR